MKTLNTYRVTRSITMAEEVLDAVARLGAGAFNQRRKPALSWRDSEIVAEHRFPFPVQEPDAAP